jgi:hypothetical protein
MLHLIRSIRIMYLFVLLLHMYAIVHVTRKSYASCKPPRYLRLLCASNNFLITISM